MEISISSNVVVIMRDVNRIDKICNELATIWKEIPDWRLGQLFVNLQRWEGYDLFFLEDEDLIQELKDFILGEE